MGLLYEILYAAITKEAADLACCGTIDHYQNRTKPSYIDVSGYFVANVSKAIELVMGGKIASVTVCNKLFKRTLLLHNLFPVGKTSEDAHMIIPYLSDCGVIVFQLLPKYHYIHHQGTITTKPYQKSDNSVIEAWENNRAIIYGHHSELIELANFRYYWSLFYVYDKMMCTREVPDMQGFLLEKQRLSRQIRKNYFPIMRNQYVGKSRKIALTGLMLHEALYRLCLKAYNKRHRQWFE